MAEADIDISRPGAVAGGSPHAMWVGRATLYCLTLFLAVAGLATATSFIWLVTSLGGHRWFYLFHSGALAAVFVVGALLFVILFVLQRWLVPPRDFRYGSLAKARVHVALTAYNDEACIGDAVREFKACPDAHCVIVVENNSRDATRERAEDAGADHVVTEPSPGYGSCCMRSLREACDGLSDDDVVVLCEGDMTFSANDIRKMLAYLENTDLVLGTRATQELRETHTQMDYLLNPGNQIVAKLIQARFWGTRLTDCGCTYRAMRAGACRRLLPQLTVRGNHFSPHMYIEALKLGMRVIEIPVVFRQRAGESKGVGSDKLKATKVALRMLGVIYRA